jgi:hypothetical protein
LRDYPPSDTVQPREREITFRDVLDSAPGDQERLGYCVVRVALVQPPPRIGGDMAIVSLVDEAKGILAIV